MDPKKNLNRTLAIDSPFQTFAVGLLVEFIVQLYHLKRFPYRENQGFSYIMRTLLYLSGNKLELALEVKALTVAVYRPDNKQNPCKLPMHIT